MKKAFNKLFHGNTDPVRKKARAIRYTYSSVPNRRKGTLIKFEEKFPPKRCFSWNKKEIRILIYQLAGNSTLHFYSVH